MSPSRKTIGLHINHYSSTYADMIIAGITRVLKKQDFNLIIFPGQNINCPTGFQYQYNIIYDYTLKSEIDALIMASGTLCNFISAGDFDAFCKQFASVPNVSLGVLREGVPSIILDNALGIKEAVSHLAVNHGRHHIAFVKGPEGNPEAESRFAAFLEGCAQNGLEVDEAIIVPGDFTPTSGLLAAKELLKNRKNKFDALIAANDEMAKGVLEFFNTSGLLIPGECSIIGFDDIEDVQYSFPSLTTIAQPISRQGELAAETAIKLLQGMPVPPVTILPSKLVVRLSCGCIGLRAEPSAGPAIPANTCGGLPNHAGKSSKEAGLDSGAPDAAMEHLLNLFSGRTVQATAEAFLSEFYCIICKNIKNGENVGHWWNNLTSMYDHLVASVNDSALLHDVFQRAMALLSELMIIDQAKQKLAYRQQHDYMKNIIASFISVVEIRELAEALQEELPLLGIPCCYVLFYQKEILHRRKDRWVIPTQVEIIVAYTEKGPIILPPESRCYSMEKCLLPKAILPADRRYTLIVNALFFREEQIGVMIFEPSDRDTLYYEILCVQLSNTLKGSLLFMSRLKTEEKLRKVLAELEIYNRKLSEMSQTDELTGLCNRRGFIDLAQQSLDLALKMNKHGMVFFADLDGLKTINDSHGHAEGDFAIKKMAEILRTVCRNADIIGRIGGDEFTILTVDTNDKFVSTLTDRLKKTLDDYNRTSGKPYTVSICIGAVPFDRDTNTSLGELLKNADAILYEQKNKKTYPCDR